MLKPLTRRQCQGLSLIELMITIAILSILLGVAAPGFQTWIQNTKIRNAAESVQNGLQRARSEAVARNANVEFVLGAGSSWTVRLIDGTVLDTRSSSEGSSNVTLIVTPVVVPPLTTVTFNSFGGAGTNADGSARVTQVDFDSSAMPPADSRELRVTIGVGGNARVCDPHILTGALAC